MYQQSAVLLISDPTTQSASVRDFSIILDKDIRMMTYYKRPVSAASERFVSSAVCGAVTFSGHVPAAGIHDIPIVLSRKDYDDAALIGLAACMRNFCCMCGLSETPVLVPARTCDILMFARHSYRAEPD
jgi:hypothetical protein